MRLFLRLSLVLVAILAAGAGGGAWWLYGSLPRTRGEIDVPRAVLSSAVEIRRDSHGIPHVFAGSMRDAHFALGYVHAQDRMFQMELMRRAGAGRLSEMIGSAGLASDRFTRTLGLYALAEAQFRAADADTREDLESYAAGVNAWLTGRHGALPPEIIALRVDPEPWKPADSLVWGKLMAIYLSGNWRDEALRLRLLKTLPREVIDSLWPASPGRDPAAAAIDSRVLESLVAAHPRPPGTPAGASNAWVVSASRSAGGKPLLANDPHLGFQIPSEWYLVHMVTPDTTLTGATAPGVPFLIVGYNGRVAWGITSAQSDVEDLFIERSDPRDPARYLAPAGPQPFTVRREVIRVRGGDDVVLEVRGTRHGVVISDLGSSAGTLGTGEALALAAPYLRDDDRTPQAIAAINRAGDAAAVERALRGFDSPQQNVLFADTAGTIGYIAAGRVPIRASGDGRYPQPGWTGESDWTGFIPFEELPHAIDPAAGMIVSANNRMVGDDYPYPLGDDFAPPYRADRIRELLRGDTARSADSMARIQLDAASLSARELVPLMLSMTPASPPLSRAIGLLGQWNGEMTRRRPEPLLFMSWLTAFHHDLIAALLPGYSGPPLNLDPLVVRNALRNQGALRCRGPDGDRCPALLAASLERVAKDLEGKGSLAGLRWGHEHQATFSHPLARANALVARLLDRAIPADGGIDTINRGGMRLNDPEHPLADIHGPGLRMVADLGDLDRSLFMIAPGQSGNPLSRHYDDLLDDWRDGRYLRLGLAARDLATPETDILKLIPR